MRRFLAGGSAVILLSSALLLAGCVPKPPAAATQTVTVNVQPPPVPPSPADLEKPPNIVFEKPGRDPFIALSAPGEKAAPSGKAGVSSGGGAGFVISGILGGRGRYSAILESGSMSYIVHPGDQVEGYRVVSITTRNVVLMRGKEKLVLSLVQ